MRKLLMAAVVVALLTGGGALAIASGVGSTHGANAGHSQYTPKVGCGDEAGVAGCPEPTRVAGEVKGVTGSSDDDATASLSADLGSPGATPTASALPFTGADLIIVATAGIVLLLLGLAARRQNHLR